MAEGNKTVLWLAGGGVAAWLLYTKVIKPDLIVPKQTKNYLGRIKVQIPTMKLDGDNLVFDMYIQNINSYPITIKGIVADLYAGLPQSNTSLKIGNITRYGDVVVKPVNETKYTFSVRIKFIQFLAYLNDLISHKASKPFYISGNININNQVYPINMKLQA